MTLLAPLTLHESSITLLIFWDVGQGSWATVVEENLCWHFDMGGEYPPPRQQLLELCKGKENRLALSHTDRDHIKFIQKYKRPLNICLTHKQAIHKRNKNLGLDVCKTKNPSLTRIYKARFLEKNDSDVFFWKNKILFPGDLPKKYERRLHHSSFSTIEYLAVSHHGSLTSSHPDFISQMPQLKQAIVSAREKVYRHPHITTRKTFKKYKIPLIETNRFGTLIYQLNP